jgi:hypothetical protein
MADYYRWCECVFCAAYVATAGLVGIAKHDGWTDPEGEQDPVPVLPTSPGPSIGATGATAGTGTSVSPFANPMVSTMIRNMGPGAKPSGS